MLVESRNPVERRCPRAWSFVALMMAALVLCAVGTYGENSKDGTVAEEESGKRTGDPPTARAAKTGGKTKPAASDNAADQAGSFCVALPGGVTLELVGVAKNNPRSKEKPRWWKPDGSTLPANPYAELGTYSNNEGRYEFAVKVGGTNDFLLLADGPEETRVSDPRLPNSLKDDKDRGYADLSFHESRRIKTKSTYAWASRPAHGELWNRGCSASWIPKPANGEMDCLWIIQRFS